MTQVSKIMSVDEFFSLYSSMENHGKSVDEKWNEHVVGRSGIKIQCSEQAISDALRMTGQPNYKIRGHAVTREEALQLIARNDSLGIESGTNPIFKDNEAAKMILNLRGLYCYEVLKAFKCDCSHFESHWVPTIEGEPVFGWIHPDGYIGIDDCIEIPDPELLDILTPWMYFATINDHLDVVVAISESEDAGDDTNESGEWRLQYGLRITGKIIEIMDREKVVKMFGAYDEMYGGGIAERCYIGDLSLENNALSVQDMIDVSDIIRRDLTNLGFGENLCDTCPVTESCKK